MTFTKRISIERYKNADEIGSAGLIEGETEDGERWIIFMDEKGKPQIYWPQRDEDGGVIGTGLPLDQGPFGGVVHMLTDGEKIDLVNDAQAIVSTWPSWANNKKINGELAGVKGAIFALVPGDGTPTEKLDKFTRAYYEAWVKDRSE